MEEIKLPIDKQEVANGAYFDLNAAYVKIMQLRDAGENHALCEALMDMIAKIESIVNREFREGK